MLEIIKRHLETIAYWFDSELTCNQFGGEVEVTGTVYFEDWDEVGSWLPLFAVAVYYTTPSGYITLKSIKFPFSAPPEDWLPGTFDDLYDIFFNKFFIQEEAQQ